MITSEQSLIDQLYRVEGKAEIVNGGIRVMEAAGEWPHTASGEIFVSLRLHVRSTGRGRACGDGLGFIVHIPNRLSFSPDAAYYDGPSAGMRFHEGAPLFAAEVRSENDYGPGAERAMVAKRADYFAAGTLVVWDVDVLSEDVVRVYRDGNTGSPAAIYRRGQRAEAEPAVPGWSMPVDDLFS